MQADSDTGSADVSRLAARHSRGARFGRRWAIGGAVAALVVVAITVAAVVLLGSGGGLNSLAAPSSSALAAAKTPQPVMWPLLGIQAPSASAILARTVVVKIDNEPGSHPEANLSAADVVFETPTEGGISRYAAVYHSQSPSVVGPVRSARESDAYIVPWFRALFARCGADFVAEAAVKNAHVEDLNQFTVPGPYFRRGPHAAPHNLYADLPALKRAGVAHGFEATLTPPHLDFGEVTATPSGSGIRVSSSFSASERFSWTWAPKAGLYARVLNGSSLGDEGSAKPYQASNVVVILAKAHLGRALDAAGNRTMDVVLRGTGSAMLFRDGRRWDCTWTARTGEPPLLRASDGTPLSLSPGITWFEVLPVGTAVTTG